MADERKKAGKWAGLHRRLGFRQALLVSGLVLAASWCAVVLAYHAQRDLIGAERDATMASMARIIAYQVVNDLAAGTRDAAAEIARRIISANTEIAYCIIQDETGYVVFDSRGLEQGQAPDDEVSRRAFEVGADVPLVLQNDWDPERKLDSMEVSVPVIEAGRKFGVVRIGYFRESFFEEEYKTKIINVVMAAKQGIEDRLGRFDLDGIRVFLNKMAHDDKDIEYCVFFDADGRAVFDTQQLDRGKLSDLRNSPALSQATALRPIATRLIKDAKGRPKRLEVAFVVAPRDIQGETKPQGKVLMGYSMSGVNQEIRSWAKRSFGYAALFALGGVLLSIWLAAGVAHPISRLADVARAVTGGNLDVKAGVRSGGEELVTLGRAFDEMISSLRAKARLDRDLEVAGDLQMNLLPKEMPRVKGIELAGRFVPSQAVGGDFYSVHSLKDGQVSLFIGDVTGHGLATAMLMAQSMYSAKYFGYHHASRGATVTSILQSVSEAMYDELSNSGRMLTLFFGIYDPRFRKLRYASAGHPAPLVVSALGAVGFLDSTSFPLGVQRDIADKKVSLRLEPGDLLAFYTDGITEAGNPEKQVLFEVAQLGRILSEHRCEPLDAILDTCFDAVEAFHSRNAEPGHEADDRTLLLMRIL